MSYVPKRHPLWREPDISRRAADGLWQVWFWRPCGTRRPVDRYDDYERVDEVNGAGYMGNTWLAASTGLPAGPPAGTFKKLVGCPWITQTHHWVPAVAAFRTKAAAQRWLDKRRVS